VSCEFKWNLLRRDAEFVVLQNEVILVAIQILVGIDLGFNFAVVVVVDASWIEEMVGRAGLRKFIFRLLVRLLLAFFFLPGPPTTNGFEESLFLVPCRLICPTARASVLDNCSKLVNKAAYA
jgi:hypothetical protein